MMDTQALLDQSQAQMAQLNSQITAKQTELQQLQDQKQALRTDIQQLKAFITYQGTQP